MKPIKQFRRVGSRIPLRFTIWLYFVLFTVAVFALIWVFQIFFFEKFYEKMRIQSTAASMDSIAEIYNSADRQNNYETVLEILSDDEEKEKLYAAVVKTGDDEDLCVEVLDKYGREMMKKHVMGECIIHDRGINSGVLLNSIDDSENGVIIKKVKHPRSGSYMLVYGCALGDPKAPDGYLLLNAALVPVGATVKIIKSQLMTITIILIILAFIISLYLSKRISAPIDRITKSAEILAKGDFNTKFDGRGYLEAKKLADTLTYAEKELSKVDTMQRDLIANVSHDLRTPLTMLKAYAEMIRDLSGDNPVKRNEHLEIIISETDRLALLVNDMLDLSKLESGKQKLNPTEFGISAKLGEIMDRFRGLSEKNGYHIHFTPDEERMVYCDVVKIEQVIYNLINNAINYTGEDKQVFVRQINTEDGVLVEVEDTGDGIEEDKIKLIFDKYYRSENHKREVVGTGLGLSIVKAVLKMHNYDYGVRSTLGKGSTFWFKISNLEKK
ncbi:HAMP domain-containing sensor histidine kinase [Ruminococcus flavefaciens]|uniref:HAMP domain-containing sensor histidine kinase n=1 Tax=Ruminococcus flavefaciens TaxID=1265 RepID=UPI0026F2D4E3|nr:HAMP domain-containing sensor histidine kinase [Ruminococcus flavefaciens]